jgi:hypothetical protein
VINLCYGQQKSLKLQCHVDENMVKGTKDVKVIQGLHMACVIFVLFYN